ncbi:MAG: hypothetical protein IPM37_05900 [Hahellaceae bacterium]|nr:hypothetical protein [Hahellaceae bacterium]
MEPIFIDFEASSLDLISSYPIEVGIASQQGGVQSWLIRPAPLWSDWSIEAEHLHGLTRNQLEAEGTNAVEVAHLLNQHIPAVCYCDAWSYDSFWFHRLFKAARVQPTFRLESITHLLNTQQMARWSEIRKHVIKDTGWDTHRAGNDARILLETWHQVREFSLIEPGIN